MNPILEFLIWWTVGSCGLVILFNGYHIFCAFRDWCRKAFGTEAPSAPAPDPDVPLERRRIRGIGVIERTGDSERRRGELRSLAGWREGR